MKLKTFLRKVPLLFGAVLLIAVFFFASCQESKQNDDNKNKEKTQETPTKTPTLSFALGDTSVGTLSGKYAEKKTNGGLTGDKTYYQVDTLDNNKHFTLTATAKNSKGAITYSLWRVDGSNDVKKITDVNIAEVDEKTGKVVIKANQDGLAYFKAEIKAKGDYKAGEKQVLVVAGSPSVPPDIVVLDKNSFVRSDYTEAMGGFGTGADADNIVHAGTALNTGGTTREDTTFTLKAKIVDAALSKYPPEAPLPVFQYLLGVTGTNYATVADTINENTGEVTLGNAATSGDSRNIQVETYPYSLGGKTLYTIKVP